MKKLITLSLFALLAGTSVALAHGGGRAHFDRLDENHDGKVTKQEAQAAAKAGFAEVDQNHDGKATKDELKARHAAMREEHANKEGTTEQRSRRGGMREKHAERMFEHMDANSDGSIDASEFAKGLLQHFERMDENGDGVVTKDELPARGHGGGRCEHGDKPSE